MFSLNTLHRLGCVLCFSFLIKTIHFCLPPSIKRFTEWYSSLSAPESRARIFFRGGSNLKVDCHTSTLSPDAPSAAQHQVTSVAGKRCICTAHKEPSVPPEQPGGLGPRPSSFGRKLLFQPPQKKRHTQRKGLINVCLCAGMSRCADVAGADESEAHRRS